MLVSAIQPCESDRSIHIAPPSWASFSLSPHLTPLGHHRALSWAPCTIRSFPPALCFTHGSVYMSALLTSSHLPLPTLCPQVHSLRLCLYSCPANRLISTMFLDSPASFWMLGAHRSFSGEPELCHYHCFTCCSNSEDFVFQVYYFGESAKIFFEVKPIYRRYAFFHLSF